MTTSQPTGRQQPAGLVPARILNEQAYCPRLAYLEWVQGEFSHSTDTLEGRFHHRRVDREEGRVPEPDELPPDLRRARSVLLSAPRLGVISKMDLVEMKGGEVVPVDVKRGRVPEVPQGAWEPERVQVAAQVLVLRENGYRAPHGELYFAGSRRRVRVEVDEALEARVRELVAEVGRMAGGERIPPPLVDSPKCPRCSLVGICLPDEITSLARRVSDREVRRMFPARADGAPLVVQEHGARVGKSGERLVVTRRDGGKAEAKLLEVSQVSLFGNVSVTAQALAELLDRGIPVCHFSHGGWFRGMTGALSKNVDVRIAQHAAAADPDAALSIARTMVVGKVMNQRTLLRRNARGDVSDAVDELRRLAELARKAGSAESLLGLEGNAARVYFSRFATMLRPPEGLDDFDFTNRNRRPPKDRVNALLSFAYALLVKDLTILTQVVGLDPHVGLFHRPRHGKPALALDLAEEMRPIVSDSIVLGVINNGEIRPADFVVRGGACALTPTGRKRLVAAHERRMDTLVRHPTFGYSISYRRVLEVQARLLSRHLLGEISEYVPFRTR